MAKRIFFGSSALQVNPYVTTDNGDSYSSTGWVVPSGIQSVGFSTSVAFEPIFQLGQTEVYGRTESQSPTVECTISKAIDGTELLYITLNGGSTAKGKLPAELAANSAELELGVYHDSIPGVGGQSGAQESFIYCSGMYISNVQYQFPLDGVAKEDITLIGDTKKWTTGATGTALSSLTESYNSGTAPSAYQRWKVDVSGSTLPSGVKDWPIQSISMTMAIGREAIQELGTRGKYCRYATFPFEVTSEFEVIAGKRPNGNSAVAVVEEAYNFENNYQLDCIPSMEAGFKDQEIIVKVCNNDTNAANPTPLTGYAFNLGTKNRVTSVNHAGGDTGGGNVTLTYSFQNYNYLVIDDV
jgi:hypothetical protein